MIRQILLFLSLVIMVTLSSNCANSGMFLASNVTSVELAEPNFKILAKNVSGESSVSYVLGISYSFGSMTESVGIIKAGGTGMLYTEAMNNLWTNIEAKIGGIKDRKIAFINVRYDSDMLNLLVYTKAKVFVRADVIEFVE